MDKSEFTRKIMGWLKSNEPTMIDNEKEIQTIYIRIPFNDLEYIYNIPASKIGKGVYEEFDFNAIYSKKEKICLFKNFWGKQANTIQEEEIGFYERSRVVKNFNKIFAKILPSIFIAKYKNKALNKIKIKETAFNQDVFPPKFFSNEEIEQLPVRIVGKVIEVRRKM